MRDIRENTVIQIDITNACHLSCQGCTRHVGHHRKPYFMHVEDVRIAIEATIDSPCRIGIMGGEPALHPQFEEILKLMQDLVPLERREFWTAGFKWGEWESLIKETFHPKLIAYNDHTSYGGMHKPLLIALDDVIDDDELKSQLIDNCPYQSHWSASITPKGAFFCEIAASLDWLFEGPGGWPVEPGWWNRKVPDYADQIKETCGKCSGCIPMPSVSDGRGGRDRNYDLISPSNYEALLKLRSPKVVRGEYTMFLEKFTRDDVEKNAHLNPREFRSFVAHKPEDVPNE